MNGDVANRLSRLIFLGTGTSQGVPVIGCQCQVCASDDFRDQRLRSSVMLESQHQRVVVDSGPDFRTQMLREDVRSMDALVYTHEHKDHVAGMDDVRPFNYLQNKALPVYASSRVEQTLRRDFHYAFDPGKHAGVPDVLIHEVTDELNFVVGGMTWTPLPVMHGKLPIHGYRVENVAYITDANFIPDETFLRLEGLEVLVLNALRQSAHYSHFSLDEALSVAEKVGAQQTWLTHVSHLMGNHADIEKGLPESVRLAYDGLVLSPTDAGWISTESSWTESSTKS